MFHGIEVIDQTIILTLHNSSNFGVVLRAACNTLMDMLDEQPIPVFLIVDISSLSNIACNTIVDRLPARDVQLLFAHPHIREVIITAPADIYSQRMNESMYKPYSTKPILITQSSDLAHSYVSETLRRHKPAANNAC